MNKLIYVCAAVLLFSCTSTTKQLGEPFTAANPITVDELLEKMTTNDSLSGVQVEGTVVKSCMSEGCWFTIKDKSGTEILFDVKDAAFKVPINSPDKTVIVLADAAKDSTSEQQLSLTVSGMMFK
jgi:sulfur carrier protein ThiS